MRTITTLSKTQEKVLNLLLKNKRTESFILLYHSEWCEFSTRIVELAEEWALKEGDETLYIISSWELPHAFAAFAVTTAPTVIEVIHGKVGVHVEYPKVYEYFNPPPKRSKKAAPARAV
jgi:hypothetical protein